MSTVQKFERAFADYVGARHAIALCNGTATLHTALAALGVGYSWTTRSVLEVGPRVAVPPLTMASTTIAVLHAGGVPVFVDVDPDTWLMDPVHGVQYAVPVSLYGLHHGLEKQYADQVDDAAQTLRPHDGYVHEFTSYSFQASKILPLGEGGMLVTNDEALAVRAREFSSLGYLMGADSPVIDKRALKDPAHVRHHSLGWNYRISEHVARKGLEFFGTVRSMTGVPDDELLVDVVRRARRKAADMYREAVSGCPWIRPQHVPDGWSHDYWAYPVAVEDRDLWHVFADAIERHGGTRPFAAWRLTYQEPAFRGLAPDGCCPVAEDLQPRIMAFQTNDRRAASCNADAVNAAIREVNG